MYAYLIWMDFINILVLFKNHISHKNSFSDILINATS